MLFFSLENTAKYTVLVQYFYYRCEITLMNTAGIKVVAVGRQFMKGGL